MLPTLEILITLLAVVAAVAVVAARLHIPSAIPLVLVGIVLALVPGLPAVELAPEFVLLLVLPPVIYWAAVAMSWREFKFNLRPISLLAVGCVVFTTGAVAAAAHWLLGLPWAVGFVLGAIVSPPDAVAPLSIARRMQMPWRLLVILEGEGLGNDATALIGRALHKLERVAIDQRRYPASGDLLWRFSDLPDRGHDISDNGPAGASVDRQHQQLFDFRAGGFRRCRQRSGYHRTLRMDLSGSVSPTLADAFARPKGPGAALAMAVRPCI